MQSLRNFGARKGSGSRAAWKRGFLWRRLSLRAAFTARNRGRHDRPRGNAVRQRRHPARAPRGAVVFGIVHYAFA